jgi:hypothetical protein
VAYEEQPVEDVLKHWAAEFCLLGQQANFLDQRGQIVSHEIAGDLEDDSFQHGGRSLFLSSEPARPRGYLEDLPLRYPNEKGPPRKGADPAAQGWLDVQGQ